MEIVNSAASAATTTTAVRVAVDRLTLAKRRWRGEAEDGRAFGFDLTTPLRDGDQFTASDGSVYVIAQKYEPVLEVSLASSAVQSPVTAARLGWLIGNLHFLIETTPEAIRVSDDSAVRQMFEREGVPFVPCKRIFKPLSGGHSH